MDLKKVDCIICKQPNKCFKDMVIHFIKHNDRCPICLSKYTSFSKMYALTGHCYSQGCNNKKNNIKGEQKLQDEFYQRLSKITGDNIIYPTNLSDDPFNHMSQQNLNENFIIDENNNNLENENENENNSFEDLGNILNQDGKENDDIEIIKEKQNGNLGNELNNYEIGYLKLGLENAKSLKFMQQILDFFKKLTLHNICNSKSDHRLDQITIFIKKFKEAKIIPDHLPPSESLFGVKTRKGRENRNSFDEDDLDKINYLVKNFNKKIFMIIPNEPINFHLLFNYPLYIKNYGAPKFTSAERFEAQFSKIKDLLTNNTNNQDKHKFERVTKILMATFLNNFNNLKEKDDDNNDLIIGQQRPQRPNTSHPPITNIVEKIFVYETLHRNCVSQYYATGKISSRFIRTCILNAGGTNPNENKVVLSKLVKWVNNKRGNTRIKALNTLRILIRNKVEQFSELLSQVTALMEYESITPFDLATLIIDTFLVSQCFTIEEKEWYSGSKPLISLIVKALRGVSQKFIDSPDELTYTKKVAFEFTSIPLYAPLN
ncbi:hypothetical protein ACTFIT_003232 [Dictyostelium discoideum]